MVMVLDRPVVENTAMEDMSQILDSMNGGGISAGGNNQFDFSFSNVDHNHSYESLETTPAQNSYLAMGTGGAGMEADSPEMLERSLALLTAQYEKTSREEDRIDLTPGMLLDKSHDKSEPDNIMPPAMVPLNNSESVRLARELRDKRDQLEQLMQKNVLTTNVNELSCSVQQPKPDRRKDTNSRHPVQGGVGGVYPGYHYQATPPSTTQQSDTLHWDPTLHTSSPPEQSNSTSNQLVRLQDQ